MRDVNRIYDILIKFQDLWEQYPDQRFGQIISNYLVNDKEDIFYIEDDELSQRLTDQLSLIEWQYECLLSVKCYGQRAARQLIYFICDV